MIQKKEESKLFFSEVVEVFLTLRTDRAGNETGPAASALSWVERRGGLCNERRSSVRLN